MISAFIDVFYCDCYLLTCLRFVDGCRQQKTVKLEKTAEESFPVFFPIYSIASFTILHGFRSLRPHLPQSIPPRPPTHSHLPPRPYTQHFTMPLNLNTYQRPSPYYTLKPISSHLPYPRQRHLAGSTAWHQSSVDHDVPGDIHGILQVALDLVQDVLAGTAEDYGARLRVLAVDDECEVTAMGMEIVYECYANKDVTMQRFILFSTDSDLSYIHIVMSRKRINIQLI